MNIDLEPVMFIGRILDDDDEYGDPYKGVFTVHKMGNKAEVVGYMGHLTIAVYREIASQLKDLGMVDVRYQHSGVEKLVETK